MDQGSGLWIHHARVQFPSFAHHIISNSKNSIWNIPIYGDEESNYHYIFSFSYFFFQAQDNPAGFFLPIGAFPSPPPCGWSTGFITTPLTTGRLPSQHFDPALPKLLSFTPTLPTCPIVAKQFWDIKRTSPDGNLNVADLPSFAISLATAPAALANCPPFPCVNSMLCMAVPKGISVEVDSSFLSKKPLPKLYKLLPKHTAF